jgi:hypothetical protein
MTFSPWHSLALTTIALATFGSLARAQTGSTVTVPTAASTVKLYVDSAYTGPFQDGPNATYKSMQAAIYHALYQNRNKENGVAKTPKDVRIIVQPGSYREQLYLTDTTNASTKTITIEAANPNQKPVFYGSEKWNAGTFGTSPLFNGYPVYYHSCNTPTGPREDIWANNNDPTVDYFSMPPVVRREEVMILNSTPMQRVLAYGELAPGKFYVNETVGPPSTGYSNYFFVPPVGTNMSTASAEVGTRPLILRVANRTNFILKNLNFQTAADYFYGAVQIQDCTNVRIEGCSLRLNGGKGLEVSGNTNMTITGCAFDLNGISGLGGSYAKNLLVQDSSASKNNWRGAQGGLKSWDSAGIKFYKMHDSAFLRITCNENYGESSGLWLDTDIKNVTVTQMTAKQSDIGFFYEAAQGPCKLLQSNVSENRLTGVHDASADNLTVDGCTIGNNGTDRRDGTAFSQVMIFGNGDTGRKYQDFEVQKANNGNAPTNIVYGNGFVFKNNKIFWNRTTEWCALYSNNGDIPGFKRFMETLTASRNQYWHADPNGPWIFQRYSGDFTNGVFTNWKADLAAVKPTGTVVESGSAYLNIIYPLP